MNVDHLTAPVTREDNRLARAQRFIARRSRSKRAQFFVHLLSPHTAASILDLGGGRGRHFPTHLPELRNVCIADHNPAALAFARQRFGFETVLLDATERLPFSDKEFDIVFCSSVIEHVTGPKDLAVDLFKRDGYAFRTISSEHQKRFAAEIRRIGKRYFVQTPNRYFPVEVHSWLPMLGYLPTHLQWAVMSITNRFWPRRDQRPDWSLLTYKEVQDLFPDAEIYREQFLGFTKSIIAVSRTWPGLDTYSS